MGSPPPEDAPPPDVQDANGASASFSASPIGFELCGFQLPFAFAFNVNFSIPLPAFAFPPTFDLAFGLSCDLDTPINAPDGGGREGTLGLDDDPEFD
jgi:hypothetical protein